ncbi:nuclear transport factor 2 family protein [Novosphingobium malaysiense]|uniref:SnoaL-like domain-containing protein n=1 Tax=Novosphingobium malaysiense TaxID=1348853 RepID=A0A0B1ZKI8_9SPHN|nr:nuclear transport factor 2 family protein [Novosphingobium malaysiense]KHK89810.1 hypothetical protein LK12_17965 [Novosphingobium malaysiense]
MDAVTRLLAIEDIKQLKARYFRCMDAKDWDALVNVFTPDAHFDMSQAWSVPDPNSGQWVPPFDDNFKLVGRDAFVAMLKDALGPMHTVHHGHCPEITVQDAEHASGIWAMEDIIRNGANQPRHSLHAYGHYHETYLKTESGWQIAEMRLTRLYIAEKITA